MTSAQSWSRRHHCLEPTSSLPIFKGLFLVIYKTLGFTFTIHERMLRTIIMQNSKLIQACFPIKIDEVWIDRFCVRYDWWRRLQPTSSVSPVWSLAFVWGIHRGPVNSPHKWPVTRKMFPFDDVIMCREMSSRHSDSVHCFVWDRT